MVKIEDFIVKIGMGQILVESANKKSNLERAQAMIKNATQKGCDIIVLPECLDIGWTCSQAKSLAEPIPGSSSKVLSKSAKEYNIIVIAGLTEQSNDKTFNTAVLYDQKGELKLIHRKINILDIAQHLYSTGDKLGVEHVNIQGKEVCIGVDICADNFPNSLVFAHSMCRMGADIILSPSAWAVAADHNNRRDKYGGMWKSAYQEICRLYDITFVGVSNVGWITSGPWEGMKCIGCSLAVGPGGEILANGSYGESAEELIEFETEIIKKDVTGTNLAKMLQMSGYKGI